MNTRVVIISCLGSIIETISLTSDAKGTIDRTMEMIGNLFRDIDRVQKGRITIYVAPCTPKGVQDFSANSKNAYVSLR